MKHGLTGYVRHKCRCDICKAAASKARKKSYQKHLIQNRARSAAYQRSHPEAGRARVAKWVAADPERARAAGRTRMKKYADANREKFRERYRVWRAANPDKARAAKQAYEKANPEKLRNNNQLRRARLLGVDIRQITERDWRRLCARYDNRCAYCGANSPLQKDHIVPISRGGRHAIGNLLPACKPCNSSKNDTLLIKWRGRRISPATNLIR